MSTNKEAHCAERIRDFAATAGLSWSNAARVLNISPSSVSRWVRALETNDVGNLPAAWIANVVAAKLDKLDAVNERVNLYANLHEMRQADKVIQLKGAIHDPMPE